MAMKTVEITAPKMETLSFHLIGTAPLMVHHFAQKSLEKMKSDQEAGSTGKKGKARVAREFGVDYEAAKYKAKAGWCGVHAAAFRNALISACKICGFQMTRAKLGLFVEADGYDVLDGTPLVKIIGEPVMDIRPARNSNGGTDLRSRPLWKEWEMDLRVRFDSTMFTIQDVSNLLLRVGLQVGIGEGRPDSKMSAGLGMGLFKIKDKK